MAGDGSASRITAVLAENPFCLNALLDSCEDSEGSGDCLLLASRAHLRNHREDYRSGNIDLFKNDIRVKFVRNLE
jgi:hypothetical protein